MVGEPRGRRCGVPPSSSSARTSRPLVALLKCETTLRGAADLVQHPHRDHPGGPGRGRPPERGVRRGAQVDHQAATGGLADASRRAACPSTSTPCRCRAATRRRTAGRRGSGRRAQQPEQPRRDREPGGRPASAPGRPARRGPAPRRARRCRPRRPARSAPARAGRRRDLVGLGRAEARAPRRRLEPGSRRRAQRRRRASSTSARCGCSAGEAQRGRGRGAGRAGEASCPPTGAAGSAPGSPYAGPDQGLDSRPTAPRERGVRRAETSREGAATPTGPALRDGHRR